MKEDINKLDQMFQEAFAGFEESPPAAVKSTVFKRILLFSTWQMIRKYVVVFVILLLVGGIAWFSGAFSSDKSGQIASQNTGVDKQVVNTLKDQNKSTVNTKVSTTNNSKESGLIENDKNKVVVDKIRNDHNTNTNLNQSEKPISIQSQQSTENTTVSGNKTIQYDETNTSQILPSTYQNSSNSQQQNLVDNSTVNAGQKVFNSTNSSEVQVGEVPLEHDIQNIETSESKKIDRSEPTENILTVTPENSKLKKNKKSSLLWSVGINLGHSLVQSDFIKTAEQVSDDNFKINSKLNFPSGFAGLNVRAEKKHFFFDFGLQYANFSEKISSNQLLSNEQQYQNIDFLGQNTIVDTNGGYWHYYYLSTTTISIVDSIWTWRIDSTQIGLYDTTYQLKYDTLKDQSWVNTYAQFEFPINVGWMKNFGKVNFGISTGPIFSLLVATKGKMPYYINSGTELIATKQEFQAFKFGVSWQIAALVNYQISDRMLVELSPYYRHTLLPFKSSTTSATLKNNSLGLQIGFRYYF